MSLTKAGHRQLRRMDRALDKVQDELLGPLSAEDRQTLTRLLTRLLDPPPTGLGAVEHAARCGDPPVAEAAVGDVTVKRIDTLGALTDAYGSAPTYRWKAVAVIPMKADVRRGRAALNGTAPGRPTKGST